MVCVYQNAPPHHLSFFYSTIHHFLSVSILYILGIRRVVVPLRMRVNLLIFIFFFRDSGGDKEHLVPFKHMHKRRSVSVWAKKRGRERVWECEGEGERIWSGIAYGTPAKNEWCLRLWLVVLVCAMCLETFVPVARGQWNLVWNMFRGKKKA